MPLLYARRETLALAGPLASQLGGIYRRTWYRNGVLLDRVRALLEHLRAAEVEHLIVRGIPLALAYYGEPAHRPTTHVELVVLRRQATPAASALAAQGWAEAPGGPEPRVFRDAAEHTCLLHLDGVFVRGYGAIADRDSWAAAEHLDVAGAPTRTLGATDALFQICVAGARGRAVPSVQWVLDATMIIRRSRERIDVERLAALARAHDATLVLREALAYLDGTYAARVPDDALRRLERSPATTRARVAHALTALPPRGVGEFPRTLARYLRATRDEGAVRTVTRFPGFLQEAWGLARPWQVPLHALERAVARLSGRRLTAPR